MRSNEKINYFYVYVYLLFSKKKKYKELELTKLEFHKLGKLEYDKRKKKSIMLKFCIYKELELGKLDYCVAWNSSLPSSSSMWHLKKKKKKSMSVQVFIFIFMKLECLKFNLHNKLEFQKSGILLLILQTVVSS